MTTEQQAAANRRNATKSTGPRTEQGRAIARLNALKHGTLATTPVVPRVEGGEHRPPSAPSPAPSVPSFSSAAP